MNTTSEADNAGVTLPAAGSAVDAASLVTEYLTAFYTGDFDRAGATMAPDFSFQGPFLEVQGRDAFFAGAQGLQPIVRGHRLLRRLSRDSEHGFLRRVKLLPLVSSHSLWVEEGRLGMYEWC